MPKPAKPGCFPMAVAAAYNKPYEASLDEERPPDGLPSQEGIQDAVIRVWTRRAQWAASQGLEWWSSKVAAPIHLSRWIAGVPSLAATSPSWIRHVVVMDRDRLWLDPAGVTSWLPPALIADEPLADLFARGGRALTYSEVALSEVTTAFWLMPTGTEIERALAGEWGLIGRPDAHQEDWVDLDAAVKVAELGEYRMYELARADGTEPCTAENVGRNDPCPCGSGRKYKQCCLQVAA